MISVYKNDGKNLLLKSSGDKKNRLISLQIIHNNGMMIARQNAKANPNKRKQKAIKSPHKNKLHNKYE